MSRRRRLNLLFGNAATLDLAALSLLKSPNDESSQAMQETGAREISYEDCQTNESLTTQNINDHTFHLPLDYKVVKILDRGAHGVVAKIVMTSTGKSLAIKQIKLDLESSHDHETNLNHWRRVCFELSVLRQLRERDAHPNVLMLDKVFFASKLNRYHIMFTTNLMETSLAILMKSRALTSEERQSFTYQIFCGLHYLHSNNIIHRDLKPANLLVSGDHLCIADLGQARVIGNEQDDLSSLLAAENANNQILTNLGMGTFIYRAPELHFGSQSYTSAVDQWSAGCTFSEMFFEPNTTLFDVGENCSNPFVIIDRIFGLIGTPKSPEDIEWLPTAWASVVRSRCSKNPLPSNWSKLSSADETAQSLIKKLLEFNPSKRFTAAHALQHKYFEHRQMPDSNVTPDCSSSLFTWPKELYALRTTEEIRDAINKEIKQLKQSN